MIKRENTCCFSGHRPTKLPWLQNGDSDECIALKAEMASRLNGFYLSGYRTFMCGMAIGCDMYFAEAVIKLREKHNDVRLIAVIPCSDQDSHWTRPQRARYRRLLDQCDDIRVMQETYSVGCMMKRNTYMVDRSSLLYACYSGKPGGTMKTILYATRQELTVVISDIV